MRTNLVFRDLSADLNDYRYFQSMPCLLIQQVECDWEHKGFFVASVLLPKSRVYQLHGSCLSQIIYSSLICGVYCCLWKSTFAKIQLDHCLTIFESFGTAWGYKYLREPVKLADVADIWMLEIRVKYFPLKWTSWFVHPDCLQNRALWTWPKGWFWKSFFVTYSWRRLFSSTWLQHRSFLASRSHSLASRCPEVARAYPPNVP